MTTSPRIAFITDALTALGGAEKVLFTALECFPQAQVYTLIYDKSKFTNTPLAGRIIKTSSLNKLPFARKYHRALFPLMPASIQEFQLENLDVVVSFNYAVAHGVQVPAHTRHISYTYTPMRYAWRDLGLNGKPNNSLPLLNPLMQSFRKWDVAAAHRVHKFAAISRAISNRIQQSYQRDSRVIYPPVDVERFHPAPQRDTYYVTLSRLVAHKRIDLVVEAFSKLKLPLIVIGNGPEMKTLKWKATSNVKFVGYQSDEEITCLLSRARGLVCASEEDFGIAIAEAQAAGCPVLAFGQGGALETVQEMKTGVFFHEQSVESLMDGLKKFERMYDSFDPEELLANARRFSKDRFQSEFSAFIKGL